MNAFLLCELSKAPTEGWFHDLFLHDGVTFATWGLVVATFLLVLYSWLSGRKQKLQWDSEDKQRKADREELRARWQRDDRSALLQRLDMLFNSAGMLSARRETGKNMQKADFFQDLKKFVPTPAWPIVSFFDRIAMLWKEGRLELIDIDITYREYSFRIWTDFDRHLSDGLLQGRYRQFKDLKDDLQKIDDLRQSDGLSAAVGVVKEEFWRRESEL